MAASLQFIKGINETCIPDVKLTRSRTGGSGTASFIFDTPDVFNADAGMGDITGLYMIDDEGVLSTVEVQAKFVNGKPKAVEAKYTMRSSFEWDRFMRFMDRYAADNGLGFSKAGV
jgi:photosystem II 13kDa protein